MNRTPAEVAGILDVDVAKVKAWAGQFKDFLSPAANPAKGKARTFSDGDLLVMMYVQHHWEEEPDLQCIESGLNLGEHHEDVFVEELYRHTPLIQEPPDDLNEDWRHGILLVGGGRHEYLELARNYRRVAETLLQTALEKDEIEPWAYPVLFAYRHTLELYLKLIGEVDEFTHKLARCVELVEARRQEKMPAPIKGWILELDGVDPAGTAFRYADADGEFAKHYEQWFDFRHFEFAMHLIFDVIDSAIVRVEAKGKPAKKKE